MRYKSIPSLLVAGGVVLAVAEFGHQSGGVPLALAELAAATAEDAGGRVDRHEFPDSSILPIDNRYN